MEFWIQGMTVTELKNLFEDLQAQGYENAEVRLAMQPSWPMEYSIDANATESSDVVEDVVYLFEGSQIGYLPAEAAENFDS